MDWKDSLASLASSLPPGDDTPPPPADAQTPTHYDRLCVQKERKGRAGKTAVIISGFSCTDAQVASIAADLKKRLGTGGSARGAEILIQGDRVADVIAALRDMGYKVGK